MVETQQPELGTSPGRTEAFYHGVNGTPDMVASGLAEESAMFNAKVPGRYTPHSVLGISMPSGNGMSQADRERHLPGGYTMPVANGISPDSVESAQVMRMMDKGGF